MTSPRNAEPATIFPGLDAQASLELEAAAFRALVAHLQERADVQNIDLMLLAGFCRNCLSNWLEDAAKSQKVALSRADARRRVYGMSYEEWKARHQTTAPAERTRAFEALSADKAG